ncbi:MAG: nucleotide sugar dehydrogenase [Candidatus Bathyarchaeota archaeon]|nr:nucleotide sugar dehydrogenase [Candidatus Bathyarchaeum sp.]
MSKTMKLASKDLESQQNRKEYTICMVGCGRTGLVSSCLFVEAGFNVIGVDTSSHIVHQLKKGKSPFTETNLRKFIEPHIKNTKFRATTNLRKAVSESDIIIIGVSASIDKKKKPDYSRLEKTCKDIGMSLTRGSLIIFQNTMGPGMTTTLAKEILETASGLEAGTDFGVAYSSTLNNSVHPSKNVPNGTKIVGGITKRSLKVACLILETITKGEIIRVKDVKTAEAVKLLEEAYKDVNIAFANEFAQFCEKAEIDFVKVRNIINPLKFSRMAGLHISKDSHFLIDEAEAVDVKFRMLSLSTKINDETLDHAIRLVRNALQSSQKPLRRSKISVFGISAIPNRKKVANSATKKLVNRLKKMGASVQVYDPFFTHNELLNMGYDAQASISKTVEGTDCLVVAVAHERFSRLNLRRLQMLMKQPASIVDMGQIVDPVKAEKAGFVYRGFGRGVWTK